MSTSDGRDKDTERRARRARLREQHPGWEPDKLRAFYRELGWTRATLIGKLKKINRAQVPFSPPSAANETVRRHEQGDNFPSPQWQAAYCHVTGGTRVDLGFCARLHPDELVAAQPRLALSRRPGDDMSAMPANAGLHSLWHAEGLPATLEEVTAALTSSDSLQRRCFLALSGVVLTAAAHEWLVADPARLAENLAGKRIGSGVVADLGAAVDTLRRLDDKLGGQVVHGMVTEQLKLVVGLIRNASYSQADGRSLYGIAAELARLAGFTSSDAGRKGGAQRFYIVGLRAAHEAGDQAISANILRCMAGGFREEDPATGVELLRSARAGTRGALTPTQNALLLEELARAYARLGERDAALRAIEDASEQMERAEPGEAPPFLYWYSASYITRAAGNSLLYLGDPRAAIPHLRRSVETLGDGFTRDLVFRQADLAVAHAQAGEEENAIDLGHRVIDDATSIDSGWARRRVDQVCREVAATGHPGAADLADHARTALPSREV